MKTKGFTLVEVLVAVFLTGLVMAGMVGLWLATVNFETSTKQEILFKNMFSIAEKQFHKDISEASSASASQASCGDGTVQFLTLFKNYVNGGCVSQQTATDTFSVVQYLYGKDAGGVLTVYRIEKFYSCTITSFAGVCIGVGSKHPVLLTNISGIMANTPSGVVQPGASFGTGVPNASVNGNFVTVTFAASKTVGKNNRPLSASFNKTFSFMGAN